MLFWKGAFLDHFRELVRQMRKHPTWSLKTLREKSYQALMDALTNRPVGARFIIPPKPSIMSVKRYAPPKKEYYCVAHVHASTGSLTTPV